MTGIKLTQFSHGAGCGCKIAPSLLTDILKTSTPDLTDENLLVGNNSRDDAAVYKMDDDTAIISTTDFFMPIADDPYTFGKIAAANAMSDVYAMGGKPLMAIAILGWPIDKLPAEVASQVMDGGRAACKEAGIVIAGGHSIDSPEPIFGLAVTGKVEISKLKRNDTATEGCRLYLTKPLGVGILSTAQKQGKLKNEHATIASDSMCKLNDVGLQLADIEGVKSMTDVTGFGLMGHLSEMCEGSKLSATIEFNKVPRIHEAEAYIKAKCLPGGLHKNWHTYHQNVDLANEAYKPFLFDPQTSGGLLIAVELHATKEVEQILQDSGLESEPFGLLTKSSDKLINVR